MKSPCRLPTPLNCSSAPWHEASSWRPLARRGAAHVVNRELSRALASWVEARALQRRQHQLLGGALVRLAQRSLCRGWAGWQATAAERRAKLAKMERSAVYLHSHSLAHAARRVCASARFATRSTRSRWW